MGRALPGARHPTGTVPGCAAPRCVPAPCHWALRLAHRAQWGLSICCSACGGAAALCESSRRHSRILQTRRGAGTGRRVRAKAASQPGSVCRCSPGLPQPHRGGAGPRGLRGAPHSPSPLSVWVKAAGGHRQGFSSPVTRPWKGLAQLYGQLREREKNTSASLSAQSRTRWCWGELRKGYSPFAFYPSVISTLTGAIKRQVWSYEAISAERPEY